MLHSHGNEGQSSATQRAMLSEPVYVSQLSVMTLSCEISRVRSSADVCVRVCVCVCVCVFGQKLRMSACVPARLLCGWIQRGVHREQWISVQVCPAILVPRKHRAASLLTGTLSGLIEKH